MTKHRLVFYPRIKDEPYVLERLEGEQWQIIHSFSSPLEAHVYIERSKHSVKVLDEYELS
jgi:hypothetical protein